MIKNKDRMCQQISNRQEIAKISSNNLKKVKTKKKTRKIKIKIIMMMEMKMTTQNNPSQKTNIKLKKL